MWPDSPTLHQLWPSLRASLGVYLHEVLGMGRQTGALPSIAWGLPIKAALVLAFRGRGDRPAPGTVLADLALPGALLAAGWASLFYSFHHWGLACCERHQTTRQGFILLALFCLAQRLPAREGACGTGRAALGALAAVLVVLGVQRWPGLMHDWRLMQATRWAKGLTWDGGRAPGAVMAWYNAPAAKVANWGLTLPPGRWVPDSDGTVHDSVGRYFGKRFIWVAE